MKYEAPDTGVTLRLTQPQRAVGQSVRPVPGQIALLGHDSQDMVPPGHRGLGVDAGVVAGRSGNEGGQHRGLVGLQLPGGHAEVRLGRRLDPVGAASEVHGVQVAGEDRLLGLVALELDRQERLLDLPLEALLVARVDVLDVLLGDRGPALLDLAVQ
jgi:hypothetical protein